MKKVIFVACIDIDQNTTGIEYKIFRQYEMLKSRFDVVHINPFRNIPIKRILSKIPFINCKFDYNELFSKKCDCIFVRYYFCSDAMINAFKKVKEINPNVKIYVEIPTYPYDNEFCFYNSIYLKDKFTRYKLKKYVDRFITYSDDKEIYGVQTLNISNGVDCKKIKCKNSIELKDESIHMIAVAYISSWHGYDRVIEGLWNYYKDQNNTVNLIFHIVGYGDDKIIKQYKQLIEKYKLEKHVIFHGKKTGSELSDLFDISTLAFDSLGRHRSGVYYNSSLKGKEYLARGIPIISGVKTELDSANDFSYYLRIPADDSSVSFNDIIEFYHRIYDNKSNDRVVQEIRNYCEKKYDLNITFKPVLDLIDSKEI